MISSESGYDLTFKVVFFLGSYCILFERPTVFLQIFWALNFNRTCFNCLFICLCVTHF